jgi:hypothetical protein
VDEALCDEVVLADAPTDVELFRPVPLLEHLAQERGQGGGGERRRGEERRGDERRREERRGEERRIRIGKTWIKEFDMREVYRVRYVASFIIHDPCRSHHGHL